MQVFIAKSTGVLGRQLVSQFTDQGHTVVGLTRDECGDELVEAHGGDTNVATYSMKNRSFEPQRGPISPFMRQ